MATNRKITIPQIKRKKKDQQPITMITAYDYPSAQLVDKAGVDIVLVGDSLAMTVMGHPNTLSVTMDEMIHHCKMVARGTEQALLVGDMPFLSCQTGPADAIRNAGRFLKEGGMEGVKIEGGSRVTEVIKAIVACEIPVMGHIGLTPQSVTKLGGYRIQGKTAIAAQQLISDANALEEAGCFAIVLEAIPTTVARIISAEISIPTIGIGAGKYCDGQVLVFHDILGFYHQTTPKFVKQYTNLNKTILEALKKYCRDVEQKKFPSDKYSFKMIQNEIQKLKNMR
jgi:3-methyl-2-oxobutanoate hydroxymethyltransferase